MDFSGVPFNTTVLVFVASTMLAVGLGTTAQMLRRTISNGHLLVGALAANMVLIPAVGWGLADLLAPAGTTFIALVLAAASPGGPFGAKLAQVQRGDAVAGAALMAILAVLGSLSVPVVVAFILSTARVGGMDDISIAVGPLIVRIVVSQVLPFFLGMAVWARVGRAADRVHPVAMLISNVSFVVILGWILLVGSGDVIRLAGPFLLAAITLIMLAILLGALLAPGPAELRTAAGAVAGIRNAAPMLAVIAAEFADEPAILAAVAGIVVIELAVQVPWNLWLAYRRTRASRVASIAPGS